MKLWLKLLRDLKQSIGQSIAFVLIIAVGAFFYAGLVTYSDHLSTYTDSYVQKHHLSDLTVTYKTLSPNEVQRFQDIEGVKRVEGRYTVEGKQQFQTGKTTVTLHSIPKKNAINTPTLLKGQLPSASNELFLDAHYAKEHNLKVGQTTTITVRNQAHVMTISGLGENVEHAKLNDIQDHVSEGFAYLPESGIKDVMGSTTYNELLVSLHKKADVENIGKVIAAQSKKQGLSYLKQESKERSFSYSKIYETIYNNNMMSKVIPIVLFLIEAIILFLSMSRLIDSERSQVGIMKALGVKNRNIMLHYMGYPLIVSILGSILGCIMANYVFVPFVRESSARAYSLPGLSFSLSFYSLIPPLVISSIFGMVACYLSGRTILKERAAMAMRPKPPKKMKQLWLERFPKMWKALPYQYKIIFRNIFLNKRKALTSSIGVVVSTVLLITAFGTQTALLKVAKQTEQVGSYDLRIDYKSGAVPATRELPAGVTARYELATTPVQLVNNQGKHNATLISTPKNNTLLHFFSSKDTAVSLDDDGVLVPKSYADRYHIKAGDTIFLQPTSQDLPHKSLSLKVSAITSQYSNPSFYGTPAYLKKVGLQIPVSSLLLKTEAAHMKKITHSLERNENVDQITTQDDAKKSANYIVKQNTFVFIMFIICAIVLSFGAIFTISSINIYERNRELATLKVLGYPKAKIHGLIFFENILLTLFAVVVALPISSYVFAKIIGALSSPHQQIPDTLPLMVIVLSIVVAFVLTILSNLFLRRKVTKINMIESLKSLE
ncbi:ABC transporter permease [Fictibacillus macauensis ZFHKF-1]|uniref:ABC transporter permease n=1 Tax=Fictibacillus macauensis ZFHKF-1 TaxID=1196324 RepID=I8J4E2_9BACL|nr:ABC transporter permease [Fictibacillus macauensis]EIT86641.1 ABC transporter permease [Fictibacillus macauensis ZFHKF-1]